MKGKNWKTESDNGSARVKKEEKERQNGITKAKNELDVDKSGEWGCGTKHRNMLSFAK